MPYRPETARTGRFHAAAAQEPRPPQTATRRRRGATADARPIDSALQPPRATDRPLGRRAAELRSDATNAQLGAQTAVLGDPVPNSRRGGDGEVTVRGSGAARTAVDRGAHSGAHVWREPWPRR